MSSDVVVSFIAVRELRRGQKFRDALDVLRNFGFKSIARVGRVTDRV